MSYTPNKPRKKEGGFFDSRCRIRVTILSGGDWRGWRKIGSTRWREKTAGETLERLTWSFSDVRGVLPLIGDRVGNVGQRQFALVELVEPGQLVELVPGLLLEEVLVVEIRPGQDTCADRRRILRSVPFRVRHHRHRVCKLINVFLSFSLS